MSEPVHRIRLREPWQTEERPGEILLYRRFGKPTRLEPGQTVWIVFPGTATMRRVTFNGQEMAETQCRWEVTDLIAERNQIDVVLNKEDDQTLIVNGVVLEIVG
ncbi:hypothetical protein [Zavarzinella formosa]|uniref:hypothetical protein n=1 Tax=Zavarzinella formosa TaxID=360055 RepID=UPI0003050534|nr:hypothetical protein [Zavarzinella formosa]